MANKLFDALVPDVPLSPGLQKVWRALIVLSPLAAVLAVWVMAATDPKTPVPVTSTSDQAIAAARALARKQGLPEQSWSAAYRFKEDSSLLGYANDHPGLVRLWDVAPPMLGLVTLSAPNSDETEEVQVSVGGKVVGYEMKHLPASGSVDDAQALGMARAQLPAGLEFGAPNVVKSGAERTYVFHAALTKEVPIVATVRVDGNQVTLDQVKAEPEEKEHDSSHAWQDASAGCGTLLACLIAAYSVYRYVSRTLQKEISHSRSLTLVAVAIVFFLAISDNAVQNTDTHIPFGILLAIFAVVGMIGGMVLASVYGSGEGDVREAYPGKLTSVDALLTGRILSRNVGVSMLAGTVIAVWLALMESLLIAPFQSGRPLATQAMLSSFTHNGLLINLVTFPMVAVAITAGGLLQPVAFLERHFRRRRWVRAALLVTCAFLIASIRTNVRTNAEYFASVGAITAGLLLPFFVRDLLSSMACVALTFYIPLEVQSAVAVPADFARHWWAYAPPALIPLWGMVCLLLGRQYREEQVRPLYARHIVQRKALEAEVSAAREAQLRLLPQRSPQFEGLDISAVCIPAEVVGGDFYDFFPLNDGRLGLFIAEGNNRGLAAALTIALAKGYLMHRVSTTRDPLEIVLRLEAALVSIFGGDAGNAGAAGSTEFAFATIDPVRREIRYARTGSYPRVVVASSHAEMKETAAHCEGREEPIQEGQASLAPGDYVFLFTDGLGRRLGSLAQTPERLAAKLKLSSAKDAEDARKRVISAAKTPADPDDLTVIVVQMKTAVPAALGVVA